jgi:peptidoglycan/LPS O-acetylase OafA/YrhL
MSNNAHSARPAYRPEIDGLRALAVISVIIYHFNKNLLPGGYLGVDIFFVISGYVITSSLYGSASKRLGDFLFDFYSRRMKRLAPALVLCVAVAGILICLFNPDPGDSLQTGIRSLFGFSNFYLFRTATDYFARSSELNVFTHTWSLGVEEQFYLLFPVLLWFLSPDRLPSGRMRRLVAVIGALSVASLFSFVYLNINNQAAAFFLVTSRFWELGAGCLLFLTLKHKSVNGVFANLPPLAVTALLVAALYIPLQFTVQATVVVVFLTTVLIACLRPQTAAYVIFTRPIVVYFGLISYSLYLWHWIVITLSRWTVGIHWWSAPVQFVLMFLLAAASHHYVEKPLRSAEWSSSRRMSISYGLTISVLASGLLIILINSLGEHLYLGSKQKSGKLKVASLILAPYSTSIKRLNLLREECNMTPHHLTGKSYRPKPVVDSQFIQQCIDSSVNTKKILLVGDSFANSISRHLTVIAGTLGYDFKIIFGYGCPYPLSFDEIKSRAGEQCKEVDEKLLQGDIISALHEGDLLVIRLFMQKNQYVAYDNGKLPTVNAYDEALSNLLTAVKTRKAKLLIIGSNPTLTLKQFQAMTPQWFNLDSDLSQNSVLRLNTPENAYYQQVDDHLQKQFAAKNSVSYFSLKPYLCDAMNVCKLADNGMLLYSDEQHLTSYAYDLVFDNLLAQIKEMLADPS